MLRTEDPFLHPIPHSEDGRVRHQWVIDTLRVRFAIVRVLISCDTSEIAAS